MFDILTNTRAFLQEESAKISSRFLVHLLATFCLHFVLKNNCTSFFDACHALTRRFVRPWCFV
jgi:hypothetical protein